VDDRLSIRDVKILANTLVLFHISKDGGVIAFVETQSSLTKQIREDILMMSSCVLFETRC